MEQTFAIIKPDAVSSGHTGAILQRIEEAGFRVAAMRMVRMTKAEAEGFYAVHRERPFFDSLTTFMSSGPAVVLALEAPDAIARWRALMGATDPARAEEGTLRRRYGSSIEHNATHGSDAPETAAFELGYFFCGAELVRPGVGAAGVRAVERRTPAGWLGAERRPQRDLAVSFGDDWRAGTVRTGARRAIRGKSAAGRP